MDQLSKATMNFNTKVSFPLSLTIILILSGLLIGEIFILLKSFPT